MPKLIAVIAVCGLLISPACKNKAAPSGQGDNPKATATTATTATSATTALAANADSVTFAIDGKSFTIPPDHITVTNRPDGSLRLYLDEPASKLELMIIIPHVESCPCTVPGGDDGENALGTMSLQHYPERTNTFSSHLKAKPTTADAIKVTALGPKDAKGRLTSIEGTFAATMYNVYLEQTDRPQQVISNGKFALRRVLEQ